MKGLIWQPQRRTALRESDSCESRRFCFASKRKRSPDMRRPCLPRWTLIPRAAPLRGAVSDLASHVRLLQAGRDEPRRLHGADHDPCLIGPNAELSRHASSMWPSRRITASVAFHAPFLLEVLVKLIVWASWGFMLHLHGYMPRREHDSFERCPRPMMSPDLTNGISLHASGCAPMVRRCA